MVTSPKSLEQEVADSLTKLMTHPEFATVAGLNRALRLLAKWRSQLIDRAVVAWQGTVIQGGPFKGMRYFATATESNVSPKLLGNYEAELQSLIEEIVTSNFDCIVNIGCADGYYAVGFARRMSNVQVFAFDTDPEARRKCSELAEMNGVADRVTVAGEFRGDDFQDYVDRRALVFVDIEGAEDDLLLPDIYPALRNLTILVECHDAVKPRLSERIAEHFASNHVVRKIQPQLRCPTLPSGFSKTSHLDQLLSVWEWRLGPTPWLYLKPSRDHSAAELRPLDGRAG